MEKNERLILFLTVNPHEAFVRCVSNFSISCSADSVVFFYVTMFLICDDVRSEYMSAHVRIDSSHAVGSPLPRLFVVVGLA